MQAKQSWLGDQAFGKDAADLVTMAYDSHREALRFLQSVLNDQNGVGLLLGPKSSGKSTTVRRLAEQLPRDTAVALIDGSRIKPRELFAGMLGQFGYDTGLESSDELVKMVNVFAVQQTRSCEPPVLIIDNIDRMYPSTLRALNMLAELKAQQRFAIRVIMSGGEGSGAIIESDVMASIANRMVGSFVISPLSVQEALIYLHARLSACGVNSADTIFPVDVCDRLYQQSGGWPGLMNQFALDAIARARDFPVSVTDTRSHDEVGHEFEEHIPVLDAASAVGRLPPQLAISRDGNKLSDYVFDQNKVLIGRSGFADIVIEDDFVSKLHAVMLLYSDALVLLDLNSANGTTVNSVKVKSTLLKDDDVISLGNHRLKVRNAPAISDDMAKFLRTSDTIKMKNLIEMRRQRARRLASVETSVRS